MRYICSCAKEHLGKQIPSFGCAKCFLGSGSNLSPPAKAGLGSPGFLANYNIFSHSQHWANPNDPPRAALKPDQASQRHLPQPKPATLGSSPRAAMGCCPLPAHRARPGCGGAALLPALWSCWRWGGNPRISAGGARVVRRWQRSISRLCLRARCLSETLTETKESPLGNLSPSAWKRARVLFGGEAEGLHTFQASAEIQSAFCERKRKGREAGRGGGGRAGEGCLNTKKLSLIKYLGRAHTSEY